MADDRRIVIEILDSKGKRGKTGGGEEEDKNESGLQSTLRTIFHPVQTLTEATLGKNIIAIQAYQKAKQLIINNIDFYHNRYFSLKEDYLSETTYNNAKTAISKVTGFLGSVGAGAIAGAKAGPVGAIAGAAIGAISFGANEYMNKMQTRSQYYQQLNESRMETAFARERAGLVNDSKGTEN